MTATDDARAFVSSNHSGNMFQIFAHHIIRDNGVLDKFFKAKSRQQCLSLSLSHSHTVIICRRPHLFPHTPAVGRGGGRRGVGVRQCRIGETRHGRDRRVDRAAARTARGRDGAAVRRWSDAGQSSDAVAKLQISVITIHCVLTDTQCIFMSSIRQCFDFFQENVAFIVSILYFVYVL